MRSAHVPRRRLRRGVALAAAATLVLGGCGLFGGDDSPAEQAKETSADGEPTAWDRAEVRDVAAGGTLRLAVTTAPTTYNPVRAGAETTEVARLLGPTTGSAVRITADGGWEVDPDYARDVEVVDEEPLTVRVRLNPDARWEGGSPITAADMVAYWKAVDGSDDDYEVASTDGWDDVEDVRPSEDDELFEYEVEFAEPRSDWPLYVYPRLAANVSKDPDVFNDAFADRAVSSNGPFVVTDIDDETGTITQERNPRWWGTTPRLEKIVWRVATAQVQAEAFAADELDVATIDAEAYETVDAERVQRASGDQWSHLTLNAGRGALRDADVRRAVSLAVDRSALAADVADPVGAEPRTADSLLVLPGQAGYDDVAKPWRRDLDEARSLLEKAGYEISGGDQPEATLDGERLTLALPVAGGTPSVAARAKKIAAQLAEIGIAVKLSTVEPEKFTDQVLLPLDFDLLTFSWGPSLLGPESAEARFRPITSLQNFTGVSSDAGPWDAAREALDPADLAKATADLDAALREQSVMVPLAVLPNAVAVREGVVNVGATTFEQPRWTTVGFLAEG